MRPQVKKTILAGGIATELLNGLRNHGTVARYESSGARLSYSLRHTAGGGMVLHADAGIDSTCLSLLPRWTKTYHLRPSQAGQARHYLTLAVTRINFEWGREAIRRHWIGLVHKQASEVTCLEEFERWVNRMESKVGVTVYSEMTEEQAIKWLGCVTEWKRKHPGLVMTALLLKGN